MGIGIAIATLTFTFAADQKIYPLFGSGGDDSGQRVRSTDVDQQTNAEEPTDGDQRVVIDVVITLALIVASGLCLFVSWHFRELYKRNDTELRSIHPDIHQEATP